MNGRKATLIHGTSNAEVEATLHDDLTAQDLMLIERVWADQRLRIMGELVKHGVPRSRWPQSLHWDWSKKAVDLGQLAVSGTGVMHGTEWQAVMMTKTQPYVARHNQDRGKPIVYVDYIEAAPWNWTIKDLSVTQRFKGCGTLLLREAVAQSFREEFHGRIGLHALPQAERLYEKLGLTSFGPDSTKQNLTYFEFTRENAQRFINGGTS